MNTRFFAVWTLTSLSLLGCAHDSRPVTVPEEKGADAMRSARAYLEISLKIEPSNRAAAAAIYSKYKQPFLSTIPGASSKELLVRDEDVVVLHGFDSTQQAEDYLKSTLFTNDVVVALKPLLAASPEVRIYAIP